MSLPSLLLFWLFRRVACLGKYNSSSKIQPCNSLVTNLMKKIPPPKFQFFTGINTRITALTTRNDVLAAGTEDGHICLFDIISGKLVMRVQFLTECVLSLDFIAADTLLAYYRPSGAIQLLKVNEDASICVEREHVPERPSLGFCGLAVCHERRLFAFATDSNSIHFLNFEVQPVHGILPMKSDKKDGMVMAMLFRNGALFVGYESGCVIRYLLNGERDVYFSMQVPICPILALAGTEENIVTLTANGKLVSQNQSTTIPFATHLSVAQDSKILATVSSQNNKLKILELQTLNRLAVVKLPLKPSCLLIERDVFHHSSPAYLQAHVFIGCESSVIFYHL